MSTEKLGKAYFWRSGNAPQGTHASFVQFLRFLGGARQSERPAITKALEFTRFDDLRNWIRDVLPLAHALEHLAPAHARDGPNPEYPWPMQGPNHAPVNFDFHVWKQLKETGRGRRLLELVRIAVERFPRFA